jgi:hypothetical protein
MSGGGETVAGDGDRLEQGAGGVDNLLGFVVAQGGEVDKVRADTESECACRDILGGVGKIHAAGGDEARLWKWGTQGFEVSGSTNASAGENFNQGGASVQSGNHLRWGEGARHGEFLSRSSNLQDRNRKAGADEKFSACIEAHFCLVGGHNGAGPGEDIAVVLANYLANDIGGVGDGHRDFDHGNAAGTDGVDGATRFVDGGRANDRDNADFLDAMQGGVDSHGGLL